MDEEVMQVARSSSRSMAAAGGGSAGGSMAEEAFAAAAGGLLFSCLGRSGGWYQSNGMAANFEPDAFSDAFPGKALAGFLANGEIFGEYIKPPGTTDAGSGQPSELAAEEADDSTTDAAAVGAMSVAELKAALRKAGVSFADCVEKSDLVSRVIESGALSKAAAAVASADDEGDEEGQDFMHGFTAVFGISTVRLLCSPVPRPHQARLIHRHCVQNVIKLSARSPPSLCC
jgi:small ligand-binding sensory domain FIST